ncbi:MAG: hypothetical protein PHQ96_02565 [Candidatus Omnitrophica bacterium]|nr:hypothetical protein [Candidatus Omnitrophota bacterium]
MLKLSQIARKYRVFCICVALLTAILFFIQRIFAVGFLIGLAAGLANSLLLNKQFAIFIKDKKLYLLFLSYIIRYFSLGLILYLAAKKNALLFYGLIAAFMLVQLFFLWVRLVKPYKNA